MTPRNYTIDDSQWATPALHLSAGWNMLRTGGSNQYINADQVSITQPLLSNFWNQSVSWTTTKGSNTTLSFVGTDIWAYGMSGPDQGAYSVLLDDHAMGPYTSKTDSASYDFLLFAAHELEDGPVHRLMIVSEDEGGGSLAFDVAVISSEVASGMNPVVSSLPSSTVPVIATNSSALADNISTIDAAAPINPVGIPTQYSKAQLASLAHPYHFKWNGAAYFVVVFSSLVTAAFAILCIRFFSRSWIKKRQARAAPTSAASGINHLIPRGLRAGQGRKPRPTTRLLEALKGRKIGTPMPSDDGHSLQADRNSAATDLSFESGERDGTAHGW